MPTGSILSILVYPHSGYLLVYHMCLSLVHCSSLFVGSLQYLTNKIESVEDIIKVVLYTQL